MVLIPADVSQLLAFAQFAAQTRRNILPPVRNEVAKATKGTADQARANAPKLTGTLAASITGTARGLRGLVTAGAPYAEFPEYGSGHGPPQPYMNPAADVTEGTFPTAVESAVVRALGF